MQKYDAQQLGNTLNAIAETFDKKPISPRALEVWFDTLKEFPMERVMSVLLGWTKGHGKPPVPADVWKILNESAIGDRERKARSEKEQRANDYVRLQATPEGARCLAVIYETLLAKPKPAPIAHWQRVLATPDLPLVSYEYANTALKRLLRGREPGQDDEAVAA